MYSDNEEVKTIHKGDLWTLWKIYQSDQKFYENFFFKLSCYLTLAFIISSFLTTISTYELILKVINTSIAILPNLIGFNLGAYILVVGFGSTEILKAITKPLQGQNKFSFYQKLNGVLGVSIIIQIAALLASFLFSLWNEIQKSLIWIPQNKCLIALIIMINIFVLFLITLLVIYSFLLLINVVKHVFMFAQTIHFCIYKELKNK